MHSSFTNVRGADALLPQVLECWASTVAPRAIVYRAERGITIEPAVAVEPDTYTFSSPDLHLVSVRVGNQTHEIVQGRDGHDLTVALDHERATSRVLDDQAAEAVARMALRVEAHFGAPQDVEWAMIARQVWARTGPADHDTDRTGRRRPQGCGNAGGHVGRTPAGRRSRGRTRSCHRAGPGTPWTGGGRRASHRGGPRRPDDRSGLAADDPPGCSAGHRPGREYVSRGDRRARAGRPVRRRDARGHQRPARRTARGRRRRVRRGTAGYGGAARGPGPGHGHPADPAECGGYGGDRHPSLRQPRDAGHGGAGRRVR
jgi:hypothetical protein